MATFKPGLVHTPVTPFAADGRVDHDAYARLIDFHIAHGADSLALPMHAGESVSLTDAEQRDLLRFAIGCVGGRVPVIAHASDAGTAIAAERARHAEQAGAAAIVATTPYYWTPPAHMLLEHLAAIGAAVRIPYYVHSAPEDMAGTRLNAELSVKLMQRLDNFAGVVDSSFDWQFMIELVDRARGIRPGFQLLCGAEFMVSTAAIGWSGCFATLAGIAPRMVRRLYDDCAADRLFEARAAQERVGALRQAVRKGTPAALKVALRALGRDCGEVRAPLLPLPAEAAAAVRAQLDAVPAFIEEPRGW